MTSTEQLEQVAREMAELAAFHEVTPMCPSIHSQVVERNIRYFTPLLAAALAALAACAREARLDEQTNYPAPHRHSASLQQDYDRLVAECPRCQRIRALERAAGESSLDPQGGQHDT